MIVVVDMATFFVEFNTVAAVAVNVVAVTASSVEIFVVVAVIVKAVVVAVVIVIIVASLCSQWAIKSSTGF